MESPWIESPKRIIESTPPKINIKPENHGLEYDFPGFQGARILRFRCD